jgi:hypothetical protein
MRFGHWLVIASLIAAGLAISMWLNSGVIFLVLRYDPSIGKWRPMEYREQDQKKYEHRGIAAPTVAELHQIFNEQKSSGKRAFDNVIRDKYWEFYSTCMHPLSMGPDIGKRKWSTANPFFYGLLALSAVCAIWCGVFFYRSTFKHETIQQKESDMKSQWNNIGALLGGIIGFVVNVVTGGTPLAAFYWCGGGAVIGYVIAIAITRKRK